MTYDYSHGFGLSTPYAFAEKAGEYLGGAFSGDKLTDMSSAVFKFIDEVGTDIATAVHTFKGDDEDTDIGTAAYSFKFDPETDVVADVFEFLGDTFTDIGTAVSEYKDDDTDVASAVYKKLKTGIDFKADEPFIGVVDKAKVKVFSKISDIDASKLKDILKSFISGDLDLSSILPSDSAASLEDIFSSSSSSDSLIKFDIPKIDFLSVVPLPYIEDSGDKTKDITLL